MTAAEVTARDQVPGCVDGQPRRAGLLLAAGSRTSRCGSSRAHAGQVPGTSVIAGAAGGHDGLSHRPGGGGLLRWQGAADDGLGEPVHQQPAGVGAGQRAAADPAQDLTPGHRIRGLARQHRGQLRSGAGEPLRRDRLGRQERADPGDLGGGRVLPGEPVQRQHRHRRQRPRIRRRPPLFQQLRGPRPHQGRVLPGGHAGLGQVARRLGDGQRQVPQRRRHPVRILLRPARPPGPAGSPPTRPGPAHRPPPAPPPPPTPGPGR